MAIPGFQDFMLPLLELARDGVEHKIRDAIEVLASRFNLSDTEKEEKLSSGTQRIIDNRTYWASTYLRKSGLLEKTQRGHFRITDRGREILSQKPDRIDIKFLRQFPDFDNFIISRVSKESAPVEEDNETTSNQTPMELLEQTHEKITHDLAQEILETIKQRSPTFFENLVIDLLVKMGYGGSRKDAGKAIGKSGDEGIDGIINEDRLGLDVIYVQAKRWENPIGRPEVQKFAGALQGQRAKKGIFITTSNFTKDAEEYALRIESKIILIDGQRLVRLMIEHNIGVTTSASYDIKKIDMDYYEE